jgi:hypothetical protein
MGQTSKYFGTVIISSASAQSACNSGKCLETRDTFEFEFHLHSNAAVHTSFFLSSVKRIQSKIRSTSSSVMGHGSIA